MSKTALLIISLAAILLASVFVYLTQGNKVKELNSTSYKSGSWPEADTAINQAKRIFELKKLQSEDFSQGPCLSNDLIPGWVADVAHNPRQPIDDLAQNQCQAYLEGRAKHFVELDPTGNILRIK